MKALQKNLNFDSFIRQGCICINLQTGIASCIGIWAERGLRFTLFRVTEVVEVDYRNKG